MYVITLKADGTAPCKHFFITAFKCCLDKVTSMPNDYDYYITILLQPFSIHRFYSGSHTLNHLNAHNCDYDMYVTRHMKVVKTHKTHDQLYTAYNRLDAHTC